MKKIIKNHKVSLLLMLIWFYPLYLFYSNPDTKYVLDLLFIPVVVILTETIYALLERKKPCLS